MTTSMSNPAYTVRTYLVSDLGRLYVLVVDDADGVTVAVTAGKAVRSEDVIGAWDWHAWNVSAVRAT